MILTIIGIVVYLVAGVYSIRHTIGEGIGIIIADGFPMWILYVAIIFWPLALCFWLYLIYTK